MRTSEHFLVGIEGEEVATCYLSLIGYTIISRNVRIQHDEIDIIAFDPEENHYVFVEVKARKELTPFHPAVNLTWNKRLKIKRSAKRWITLLETEAAYRIDVIFVVDSKVVGHIRDLM